MKPIPIEQYLKRLSNGEPVAPRERANLFLARNNASSSQSAAATVSPAFASRNSASRLEPARPETSRRIEEARAAGYQEGHAACAREQDAALAEERDRLREELERQKIEWVEQQSAAISTAISSGLAEFEKEAALAIVNILKPFLIGQIINKITDALTANLNELLARKSDCMFQITGPQNLLDALRGKLSSVGVAIEYTPSEGFDVIVRADHTTIETQLGAWMQALQNLPG